MEEQMKKRKLLDYLLIIAFPVFLTILIISVMAYNYFSSRKITNFIPNLYEISTILIIINISFIIYNIKDYKKDEKKHPKK